MSLRILCPSCEAHVTLDEGLQSASCPQCQRWLHAIQCANCQRAFVALGERSQECPRCSKTVRIAPAKLRTFGDARDPDTGVVLVVERRGPPPISATRLPPRSGGPLDPRAVPRFLVKFFRAAAWIVIVIGVVSTLVGDAVLAKYHHSFWTVLLETLAGLVWTALAAALFAFCSYTLSMLLELVERPSGTAPSQSAGGTPTRELWD